MEDQGMAKKFNTDLTDYSVRHSEKTVPGIFMLKTLRDRGYKVVVFEVGNDLGGTWRWNCYPGAGVDLEVPEYEFSWPEVWKTWSWSSNYPTYKDLRAYFDHVDKVLGVKKDCSFNTVVAARRYTPDWPGMDELQGELHHSSFWPEQPVAVESERCAVIGTGASGVQIVQAWGPTLLSNGPSTVEVQGRWIADMMDKMSRGGIRYVNPKPEAADAYKKKIVELNDRALFPTTRSTYMGGSIPGKIYEPVCWAGGIPAYKREIREALDRMDGFEMVKG
ncbi:uncharacterized protein PpBr36_10516 [Pyricularia pennisetigena]|uniref:uncharacterized protein n=1 Tax=Pyricularia pennisetigena TaxID=1578925 RepID=UPI001151C065|nr:uncharacterized protein PpBr36_10516 [Pyricularia pennisetigena]TLS21124.1 hypothetical protein PpBr36_10516 [Pyricularia pennisetigena]